MDSRLADVCQLRSPLLTVTILGLLVLMAAATAQAQSPPVPTSHWMFDDDVATCVALDDIGLEHGTLEPNCPTNAPASTPLGQIDSAFDFDGVDDFVSLGDLEAIDLAAAFTISAWINPDTLKDFAGIVTKRQTGGVASIELLLGGGSPGSGGNNDIFFRVVNTGGAIQDIKGVTTGNLISTGTWTHVAAVFDGSQSGDNAQTAKVYIDGVEQTLLFTGTFPATTPANSADLVIGQLADAIFFDGQIDEVRFYDHVLSPSEVLELAEEPLAPQVTANFSASPLNGDVPLTVSFTDLSTSVNTTITGYAWDFDHDGVVDSTAQNPQHTYSLPGTFTVSLTVSDGALQDTATQLDVILVDAPNTGGGGPIGSVIAFAGTTAPTGWIFCDGSEISRANFPQLFNVIGTTYGAGDGSTTFNVPDLRGRVPVGAGLGAGLTTRLLGDLGGEEDHLLTVDEMPAHVHGSDSTKGFMVQDSGSNGHQNSAGNPDHREELRANTASTGGSQPHNVMQPYAVVHFIVRGF